LGDPSSERGAHHGGARARRRRSFDRLLPLHMWVSSMFSLEGKKALVTGASGGLGDAIARALHAQGAHVALSGTRAEKLQALAGELDERVAVTPCDLSDAAAVDALFDQAASALGGLDIIVANAGITRDGLLLRMKDED